MRLPRHLYASHISWRVRDNTIFESRIRLIRGAQKIQNGGDAKETKQTRKVTYFDQMKLKTTEDDSDNQCYVKTISAQTIDFKRFDKPIFFDLL